MRKIADVKATVMAIGGLASAVTFGALAAFSTGRLMLLAIGGVAFLAWRPTVALVIILCLAQEIKPGFGFSGMTVFGADLYFGLVAKMPVVLLLLAVAAFAALTTRGVNFKRINHFPLTFAVVVALVLGTTWSGMASGMDIASALGHVARPFLIFALAWVVGVGYGSDLQTLRVTALAGGASIIALAAVGLPVALMSGSLAGGGLVYYDTATAAIAASVMLALLRSGHLTKGRIALLLCAGVVLVVSFRRSVILSLMLVLAVMFFISKGSRRAVKRGLVWAGGFISVGMVVMPSLLTTFADRLVSSYETLRGTNDEVSTAGHVDDIWTGLHYAVAQPWGYGPSSPQLTGFFVQGGTLYLHNELLLDWLRFGFIGLIAVLALYVSMMRDCVKVFLQPNGEPVPVAVAASAFLMPTFVISSFSAPFLTTTNRWPAILGLAAGILLAYHSTRRSGFPADVGKVQRQFMSRERHEPSGNLARRSIR